MAAAGAAAGLVLWEAAPTPLVLALGFAFAAFALPLYPLCVAHANDFVGSGEVVETSSELLMMFGLGAIAGPLAASAAMAAVGIEGVFLFTATVHVVLCAFVVYRMARRAPVPAEERPGFVVLPGGSLSSPTVFQFDPRSDGGDDGSSKPDAASAAPTP